jgi:hypothetical protein
MGHQLKWHRREGEALQTVADEMLPEVIPEIELQGRPAERLTLVDAAIARLRELRRALAGENEKARYEFYSPHVNASVWPWTVAGWTLAVIVMLLFLAMWLRSSVTP